MARDSRAAAPAWLKRVFIWAHGADLATDCFGANLYEAADIVAGALLRILETSGRRPRFLQQGGKTTGITWDT